MALNPLQLAALERLIHARRAALVSALRDEVARGETDAREALVGSVPDSGDRALADLIAYLDDAEVSREIEEIRELEAALARIAGGRYGECADCSAEIPMARLEVAPTALRCVECQQRHESTHAHPGGPTL